MRKKHFTLISALLLSTVVFSLPLKAETTSQSDITFKNFSQFTTPQIESKEDEAVNYKEKFEQLKKNLKKSSQTIDPKEIKITGENLSDEDQPTTHLNRFGRSFFSEGNISFSENTLSIGPDYVVGPGDEVKVSIWGLEEGHFALTVGRDGSLALPNAGAIGAGGLSFAQLQKAIEKAYSRYYNDVEINVTMGHIHSIRVYITGQAERPGSYTLSATSTMLDAIVQAQGPSLAGSMRKVLLKRGGKTVAKMDLYSLLLNGDRSNDKRLRQGDVIFFPPVGALVGVAGFVKVPAVYELSKTPTSLKDVIFMAGGSTSSSFKDRVRITRTMKNSIRTAFEVPLIENGRINTTPIRRGDLIRVFSVEEEPVVATLTGAVVRQGKYSIQPGITTVKDLIARGGGLKEEASSRAELTRVEKTPEGPKTTRYEINIKDLNLPQNNMRLKKHDFITIYAVPDWHLNETVRLTGEVRYPGIYSIKKGETLSSVIERAGGFTADAFPEGSVFTRESVRVQQEKEYKKMLDRLQRDVLSTTAASSAAAAAAEGSGSGEAATALSGQVQDLIKSLRSMKPIGRIVINMPRDYKLLKGTPYDIPLEKSDRLHIPERMSTVNVMGAVYNPTAFIYRPDQIYPHYLKEAGGFNTNADRKRVYIIRADGSATRGIIKKHYQEVRPGDTIIVPEKVFISTGMRQTSTIIDMVYKVAVAVAAVTD